MKTSNKYLIATLVVALSMSNSFARADKDGPKIGDAPPPLTLTKMLQGPPAEEVTWTKLKGKVVVLEFWDTRCAPCVASIPHLNELVGQLKNKPVVFLSVTDENTDYVRNFLKRKPIAGWVAEDGPLAATQTAFDVRGIPHTVIVDASGRIAAIGANAGAYVDRAVRPGVDKISFVRRDYDGLPGQSFAPYTNQFNDYYLSNNTVVAQQLERVITEPDIVFSAGNGDQGVVTNAQITRTGTSNWWNGATLPGTIGPGLIRPPIKLTFSKPVEILETWDWSPNSASDYLNLWGSFDGSTNPPVVYPLGAEAHDLTINLHLIRGGTVLGGASWQIRLAPQETILVLTSTDLVNWVPQVFHCGGLQVEWSHHCADSRRFFRIVPNH